MGIDRPVDDEDIPADDGDTTLIEAINGLGDNLIELDLDTVDDSTRLQYQLQYREKVDATYARERWAADKPRLEAEWSDHARQHAAPADAAADLGEATIADVKRGCEQIRETEDSIIGPAIRAIEAQDPDRQLVGFDNRLKGEDRIIEKVVGLMEAEAELSPGEALANVKDAIRYTFQYSEERYTEGVGADMERLKAAGFELVKLRNSWESGDYKGINSWWQSSEKKQLFEVQFHTQISFEAKQLTHEAYERLRCGAASEKERDALDAFQQRVTAYVPVPRGAFDYSEFQ